MFPVGFRGTLGIHGDSLGFPGFRSKFVTYLWIREDSRNANQSGVAHLLGLVDVPLGRPPILLPKRRADDVGAEILFAQNSGAHMAQLMRRDWRKFRRLP